MSEMFKDLVNRAKETVNPIVDKARDMVESGELKDKAAGAFADVKEKAAPVLDKVKDTAGDVVDKVKEGVTTVMSGEKPALDVKNELFSQLGEAVAEDKDAIQQQAAEMQKKIEEMLGEDKE